MPLLFSSTVNSSLVAGCTNCISVLANRFIPITMSPNWSTCGYRVCPGMYYWTSHMLSSSWYGMICCCFSRSIMGWRYVGKGVNFFSIHFLCWL